MPSIPDRSDPAAAKAVLDHLFTGMPPGVKRSYFRFLVADIRHLASLHEDRWGVTLWPWGVRLNVGWVECLVLCSGGLRVLLDQQLAPAHSRFDGRPYRWAPGCRMTTIPLSKLSQALPFLEEAHFTALCCAAQRPSPRNIRGAHSVGVTAILSKAVGCRLPNPSYVDL